QQALDRRPDHGPSRLELAWVHMQGRGLDRAGAVLADLLAAPAGADAGGAPDLRHDWRLHRMKAVLLLEQGRPLEAFDAYPPNPPEEIHVTQWWREYLYMAEAAGGLRGAGGNAAVVLRRLEQRRSELEMLFGSDGHHGAAVDEMPQIRSIMARLATA